MPILSGVSGNALASALAVSHALGIWAHGSIDTGAVEVISDVRADPLVFDLTDGDCDTDPMCPGFSADYAAEDGDTEQQVRLMDEGSGWVARFSSSTSLTHFAGATDAIVCRIASTDSSAPSDPDGYTLETTRVAAGEHDTVLTPSESTTPDPDANLAVRCAGFDSTGALLATVLISWENAGRFVIGSTTMAGTAIRGD
jgi:hypothetical protein